MVLVMWTLGLHKKPKLEQDTVSLTGAKGIAFAHQSRLRRTVSPAPAQRLPC